MTKTFYTKTFDKNDPNFLWLILIGFGGHSGVAGSLASRTFDTATAATSGATALGTSNYSNNSYSSKGLSFKEVLAVLVLLTRGTHEEKIKCKYVEEAHINRIFNTRKFTKQIYIYAAIMKKCLF